MRHWRCFQRRLKKGLTSGVRKKIMLVMEVFQIDRQTDMFVCLHMYIYIIYICKMHKHHCALCIGVYTYIHRCV